MNRIIVLDCSASCAWFLPDESSPYAEKILDDILNQSTKMLVPTLWWYEVINVIRITVQQKRIDVGTSQKTLFFLKEIPKTVVDPGKQEQYGILKTALEENLSGYDAAYLHLAASTGSELFTSDSDLLTLRSKYTFIHSLKEY